MEQATQLDTRSSSQLSPKERVLLVLPLAGSAFVGLFQLLLPALLAKLTGYSGNDIYVYRLSGAATFGYAVALTLALIQNDWAATQLVIIAFFTFGLGSLYACGIDIAGGSAQPVVYVVLGLTVLFVAITGTTLYNHRATTKSAPNIATWVVVFLVIATLLAATFGLSPLLLPHALNASLGLKGTDVFIFRQAGAASLGYAVMGIFEIRSRNWHEIRYPLIMAGVFNGLGFIASLVAFAQEPSPLAYLVAPASLAVTAIILVILRRQGR